MSGNSKRPIRALGVAFCAVIVSGMALGSDPKGGSQKPPAEPKFLGSKKCESCHDSKDKGEQYSLWANGPHAKAFEVLASDHAKEVAAKLGIEDPQTSEQCLPCHTTAHGVAADRLQRGFDPKGVGCEVCHGPGETHFKERMKGAAKAGSGPVEIPAGEIVASPPMATCLECHNEKSPTFKPFCYKHRWEQIAHLDPRKPRSAEAMEAMKCTCEESCTCATGECAVHPDKD